jgi:hypothetical protein
MSCIQVYVSESTSRSNLDVKRVSNPVNINVDVKERIKTSITNLSNVRLHVIPTVDKNRLNVTVSIVLTVQPTITLAITPIKFSYSAVCMVTPVIPSCYGAGYWIGTNPWIGETAWRGK